MTVAEHAAKDAATLARIEAAFAGLTADIAWMKAEIIRLGGGGPPPPIDDAAILAELKDNTAAGVDKRLGPKAPGSLVAPEVWLRSQSPTSDIGWGAPNMPAFSTGMSIGTTVIGANFDFGGSEENVIGAADNPFTFVGDQASDGVGVYRARSEEHTNGFVQTAPVAPYNGQSIPDRDTANAIGDMGVQLGRPIAITRGKIDRYDGGVVLYDLSRGGQGYAGWVGTQTCRPFWGEGLGTDLVPTCVALSSQSEFMVIAGHNTKTGKGQMLTFWIWSGNDLQWQQNEEGFPPDFRLAHPGLKNCGRPTGMKLFAATDLPVKWPTSIDFVCSRNTTGDRIEGSDGNAAYLSSWDLSTQAGRDAFMAKNGGWISDWGRVAVASKYESKLVTIDLTALFVGVKAQYFTDEAGYQQTRYADPGKNWWAAYNLTDPMQFPWGVEAKPAWVPVITRVIDLPTPPNAMLMSENGEADITVAGADGNLRFYKWADGSANGVLKVGDNPVHLCHDKYPGIRNGGPVVTCRQSRSVVVTSGWGPSATVLQTIQANAIIDPVATASIDSHNVQDRAFAIADFSGKQLVTVRTTPYKVVQTGTVFGMGPDGTDALEIGGILKFPAALHGVSDSNVN